MTGLVIPKIDTWQKATSNHLQQCANQVADAANPILLGEEQINFAELADVAEEAIMRLTRPRQIDRDRCIYVISLDELADAAAIMTAFRDPNRRSALRLPQDNQHDSKCLNESKCLYVGSSCATGNRRHTLRSRLRQHLIGGNVATYALSLSKWTSGLKGGIVVRAWQYPKVQSEEDTIEMDKHARNIVLAVEDWLAGELRPMLGRRGSRH